MKKIFNLSFLLLCFSSSHAAISTVSDPGKVYTAEKGKQVFFQGFGEMPADEFLALTPKQYKAKTGKKLGVKKTVQLKIAQHFMKKKPVRGTDIPQWLYVLMSIFWMGWLAMGIIDDWQGNNWWIALILYGAGWFLPFRIFLAWLPGFIFSMIKMSDYY